MTYDELVQAYGKPTYSQEYDLVQEDAESQEKIINTITRLSFKKS